MLNEEITKKLQHVEERLSKLENAVFLNSFVSTKDIEISIIKKIDELKTQHLIVVALKLKGSQTRDELKKSLQDWGKVFGSWFSGGNFTGRLLKTSIIKTVEKNEAGKDVFSLTKKGIILADDLIKNIEK